MSTANRNARAPATSTTGAKNTARVISPDHDSLKKRMTVDKNVVEELLLVCGVLGTADEGQMVPVEDCLNWLQDLQRALRRDDDLYRPISLFLGDLKVVEQKLLPLVISCRYDTALVLTICKILVILTKPLAENTVRAGRMEINSSRKNKDTQ
jgi:timeless